MQTSHNSGGPMFVYYTVRVFNETLSRKDRSHRGSRHRVGTWAVQFLLIRVDLPRVFFGPF
jgi:hypothetical protein